MIDLVEDFVSGWEPKLSHSSGSSHQAGGDNIPETYHGNNLSRNRYQVWHGSNILRRKVGKERRFGKKHNV